MFNVLHSVKLIVLNDDDDDDAYYTKHRQRQRRSALSIASGDYRTPSIRETVIGVPNTDRSAAPAA